MCWLLGINKPNCFINSRPTGISLVGSWPDYDGTTELWFDSVDDIGKVFGSEQYMQIIRPDEAKFLDLPGCGFLVCQENLVFDAH